MDFAAEVCYLLFYPEDNANTSILWWIYGKGCRQPCSLGNSQARLANCLQFLWVCAINL